MVKATSLQKFLRSKVSDSNQDDVQANVDWDARKIDWLRSLSELHALVRKWLAPLEREGVLHFHTSRVRLEEDLIGSYEADVLNILIGQQRVAIIPKGTVIVGATGRVDIRGPVGIQTIILNDGKWLAVERSPKLRMLRFNQKLFQHILGEVME